MLKYLPNELYIDIVIHSYLYLTLIILLLLFNVINIIFEYRYIQLICSVIKEYVILYYTDIASVIKRYVILYNTEIAPVIIAYAIVYNTEIIIGIRCLIALYCYIKYFFNITHFFEIMYCMDESTEARINLQDKIAKVEKNIEYFRGQVSEADKDFKEVLDTKSHCENNGHMAE